MLVEYLFEQVYVSVSHSQSSSRTVVRSVTRCQVSGRLATGAVAFCICVTCAGFFSVFRVPQLQG